MSWTERAQRPWRVDVQLGVLLALIFAPLVAVVLFSLYAYAASELLELAQAEVDERLAQLETSLGEPDPALRSAELGLLGKQLARDGGGFLVQDEDGAEILSQGAPLRGPSADEPQMRWLAAVRLDRDEALRGERRLPSGQLLQIEVSSRGFVRERDEIQRGFWLSLALGVALAVVGALPATRYALAPLRRATAAAQRVDAYRLAARLPVRGVRDDLDRHAEAVNQLLERLETGFARIRRFSQDVAHELRTPVNRMLNVAEIALLEPELGERARADLESIRDDAGYLARTIDGLLLLARSEEGHLQLATQRLDVGVLCRTLAEMYGPVCEEQGLRLAVDVDVPGEVFGEAALLLRAVGNLIDNAMAHSPPGGLVRLAAAPAGAPSSAWIEIEVADGGPGVVRADRERIFERFVRAGPTSTSPGAARATALRRNGSGLGLAIARGLIRAHRGEIELRDAVQGGARFVVRLPRATAA
jgi:two-component system heavy metal sensor histidine kinase CusS